MLCECQSDKHEIRAFAVAPKYFFAPDKGTLACLQGVNNLSANLYSLSNARVRAGTFLQAYFPRSKISRDRITMILE